MGSKYTLVEVLERLVNHIASHLGLVGFMVTSTSLSHIGEANGVGSK